MAVVLIAPFFFQSFQRRQETRVTEFLSGFKSKHTYIVGREFIKQRLDNTLIVSFRQSDDCLTPCVTVGIVETSDKRGTDLWCVSWKHLSESKCRPITNVGIHICRKVNQRSDSGLIFMAGHAMHDTIADIFTGMGHEWNEKLYCSYVIEMSKGNCDCLQYERRCLGQEHAGQGLEAIFRKASFRHT